MKRNIKHALNITISTAMTTMLLSVGSVFGAQNATSGYLNPDLKSETAAESDGGSMNNGTNGITARIQADLESVKSKINEALFFQPFAPSCDFGVTSGWSEGREQSAALAAGRNHSSRAAENYLF